MKYATIMFCFIVVYICFFYTWYTQADVWFVEAENFEEERSVLRTNKGGVNVRWSINEDKKAL